MSVRLSMGRPRACSGLMYAAVPRIVPARVAAMLNVGECAGSPPEDSSARALASPKSSTLTLPSGVILMLAGFKSL